MTLHEYLLIQEPTCNIRYNNSFWYHHTPDQDTFIDLKNNKKIQMDHLVFDKPLSEQLNIALDEIILPAHISVEGKRWFFTYNGNMIYEETTYTENPYLPHLQDAHPDRPHTITLFDSTRRIFQHGVHMGTYIITNNIKGNKIVIGMANFTKDPPSFVGFALAKDLDELKEYLKKDILTTLF